MKRGRGFVNRGTALARRSAKVAELYATQRVPAIKAAMEAHQPCQASARIADVDLAVANRCGLAAVDLHEVLTRGRGGSITDMANMILVCRPCHTWITEHPIEAEQLGLVQSSWSAGW